MIIPSNPGMFRRVDISDEDIDSFSPRKSDLKSLKSFKSDFTLKNSLTNSYRNKNFSFKVNAQNLEELCKEYINDNGEELLKLALFR